MFQALAALFAIAVLVAPPQSSGLDLASIDKSVAPGDDFFGYANGAWVKSTPIPEDRGDYGVASVLVDEARKRTVELIQASADAGTDPDARKIADCYASFMDEAGIEAKGIKPLKPRLDAILALTDKRALAKALGAQLRADVDPLNATHFETRHLMGLFVAQALEAPEHNRAYLLQGGLGLPDREYYVSATPRMAELRTKYQAHVAAVLKQAGFSEPDAKAAKIFELEKKIATVHANRTESEDVHGTAVWKREEFATRAPGLDWGTFFEAAGLGGEKLLTLWHPKPIAGLSALVASEPLDAWKSWLAFHTLEEVTNLLPRAFVDERFAFYGKTLHGVPKLRERWKRGADFTNDLLGEAIGKLYVRRYFPPESKAKAQAMVDDIVKAFSKRVDALEWMSPKTKARAQEKIATLKVGVGYPDKGRDFSSLEISPDDLTGNAFRGSLFEYRRNLAKLTVAPDRDEWWMVPQEVNAVNLPLQNALNFPAAILQPPYFDPAADPALNYGAIGATIGHEISHSFDNLGSEFDAKGRLDNWWTPEDRAHFKVASEKLVKQYGAYKPFPDLAVNGELTLGENIADVAGLAAAYDAYKLSLHGKAALVRDGFTGDQRFFLGFAQSWKDKVREPMLRAQVVSDGHAPEEYRADTVRNLDAWYTAFKVKPTQKLFLKPADRVRVW